MLKITKAADPITVERLNVCLYGQPGAGKTSIAFTAASPLLLDFDRGAHRAENRKDAVRVTAWPEVTSITADDLKDYQTIIVDTAGRALDALTADIIARNPKLGRGGALTLQGYGALKSEFVAWLKLLNSFGKDVVLIAHMDEQRNGDDVIERLDVQGGSKGEIYKAADAMGRIFVKGNKRELDFSPRENSFGKNPGQLDVLEIPHPDVAPAFLAGVMQSIKDKLNTLTKEQRAAQSALEGWREAIAEMEAADDFNDRLPAIKLQSKAIQALFANAAKDKGHIFDKVSGKYISKQEAA
ncbi:MAG TPA: ATP-binding protein [Burkholderiales bacterium]|nr:ATP-binding protein [Burkholderiales bacterium]